MNSLRLSVVVCWCLPTKEILKLTSQSHKQLPFCAVYVLPKSTHIHTQKGWWRWRWDSVECISSIRDCLWAFQEICAETITTHTNDWQTRPSSILCNPVLFVCLYYLQWSNTVRTHTHTHMGKHLIVQSPPSNFPMWKLYGAFDGLGGVGVSQVVAAAATGPCAVSLFPH